MKHIKLFENHLTLEDFKTKVLELAWGNKYLYHFTLDDNLDDIYDEGLIPRLNPNSYYDNANIGVCLTSNNSFHKTNLPGIFADMLDELEDINYHQFVRLKVDISMLDFDKFVADDDYSFKNNETEKEAALNSLISGYGITYLDKIDSAFIVEDTKNFPW